MDKKRKSAKLVLAATAILFLILGTILVRNADLGQAKRIFEMRIANPIPHSVRILDFDQTSRREWRMIFHFSISPAEFSLLIGAKKYSRLEPQSVDFKNFIDSTYNLFQTKLPSRSQIDGYEVYECFDDSAGTVTYLISNSSHSEVFALSIRF